MCLLLPTAECTFCRYDRATTTYSRSAGRIHWLLDSERILSELSRVRKLALRIPPVRNDASVTVSTCILLAYMGSHDNMIKSCAMRRASAIPVKLQRPICAAETAYEDRTPPRRTPDWMYFPFGYSLGGPVT